MTVARARGMRKRLMPGARLRPAGLRRPIRPIGSFRLPFVAVAFFGALTSIAGRTDAGPVATRRVDEHGVRFEHGFPVTDPTHIFKLSEILRGQKGVGYTVFEEDRLEAFGVEVLGVMEGMLGPGEDVILAKLTGPRISFTGVISGMSGSPVYIDGRLVGAVAYRFGSFSKEPIAGITPIERMLPLLEVPDRESAAGSHAMRAKPIEVGPELGRAPRLDGPEPIPFRATGSTDGRARAIATPFSVSGLHPGAQARLNELVSPVGFVSGSAGRGPTRGANTASRAGKVAAAPIRPGAPIAALIAQGDVNLAAIGTVTYVHDGKVLAFGHPFVGQGRVAFPLATASILNTLASEAGSFKQGLAAREVGVVSQDRLTAISGRIGGSQAPLVPVRIAVHDGPRRFRPTDVDIVDSPVWLPVIADTVVTSAVLKRISAEAGGTVKMIAGIEVGDRYLEVTDAYAAPAPTRVAQYAARDLAQLLAIVSRNPLESAPVRRVEVRLEVSPEVSAYRVEAATLRSARVRPGERLEIEVRLRPYRGPLETRRLEVGVPYDAPLGTASVVVGGGLELDRRDAEARGRLAPQSLDDLLGVLADRRPAQAVYARLYFPQEGLRIGAEVYEALPLSRRAALQSQPALGSELIRERPGPSTSLPVDGVVSGRIALSARVMADRARGEEANP